MIIGVSYNSPSSNDTCRDIINNVCSTYKNVTVCGDFNYPS